MKYLALALLLLTACSSSETVSDSGGLPLDSTEPAMSSDTLLTTEASEATEAPLATPVDPAPSSDLALSEPTPPGPPPPPAYEPESEPIPSAQNTPSSSMPPVVAGAVSPSNDRNIRQDFEEYKDRMNTRADVDDDFDARSLFPHEDGAFQFGFDYAYKPFSEYDFDPTTAVRNTDDTQGAYLAFNYFPLRSLSFGRLGAGLQAGATWAKFDYTSAGAQVTSRHRIESYGAKAIYEFQYFLGQIVVPHAFYGVEKIRVKNTGGVTAFPATSFNSASYGGGAHINLNRLESSAASKALATSGVRKFYLTYTYQQRAESTGAGHFLGLRFEY